ncbi:hypothetical protein [Hymenobacter chitinivorans]|uniref:Dolichyl-phosphate-mannose-protein mannosyltransferase n=1 Tax=Hymenobacter chitinivorans DSM 11115 TaxID=1121954 RepID=A0A2M9BLC9_9BACT|nr:hypothetical protein [Hymenobacter chitinivorans]PJJ58759.1 hypothetical protein CLV45_0169 [Hymenobacter chitinivorans DSM 11115]
MPLTAFWKSFWPVYLFAVALLWGNSCVVLANHSGRYTIDEQSYLQMAQGNFDVNVTHRYRIIVPLVAGAIARIGAGPARAVLGTDESVLSGSFFLVNTLLLAGAGLYLYRLARAHGAAAGSSLIGMAAVLTCGAAAYVTGFVLVDSAVVLMVVLLYYALTVRSAPLLLAVILLAPALKESLVLFLPVVVLYGGFVPLWQRLVTMLCAAALVAGLHAVVDALAPPAALGSVVNALRHGYNMLSNLRWLLSARGLFICSGVYGLFNLVVLAGFWGGKSAIEQWLPRLRGSLVLCVLAIVVVHMLLSGEMSRMLLLAAPVVSTAVALIVDRHPLFTALRRLWPVELAK